MYKAKFVNNQLWIDEGLFKHLSEKFGVDDKDGKQYIHVGSYFSSNLVAEKKDGGYYKVVPAGSQFNERPVLQLEAYWDILKHGDVVLEGEVPIFYRMWYGNRGVPMNDKRIVGENKMNEQKETFYIVKGSKPVDSFYLNELPTKHVWYGDVKDKSLHKYKDHLNQVELPVPSKMFPIRKNSWMVFNSKKDAEDYLKHAEKSIKSDKRFKPHIKDSLLKYLKGMKIVSKMTKENKMNEAKNNAKFVKEDGKWYLETTHMGKQPISRFGIKSKGDKAYLYYLRNNKEDAEHYGTKYKDPNDDVNKYYPTRAAAKKAQKGGWSFLEIGVKEIDLNNIKPLSNARNVIFTGTQGRKIVPAKVVENTSGEDKMNEQTLSKLQLAYREFFKAKMEEFGIKSPVELKTDEKRKEFWNSVKKEWPAAKKNITEGVFRQAIRSYIAELMDNPDVEIEPIETGEVNTKTHHKVNEAMKPGVLFDVLQEYWNKLMPLLREMKKHSPKGYPHLKKAIEHLDDAMNELMTDAKLMDGVIKEGCDPKELRAGIAVEMEHTDDPEEAKRIAIDHLKEDPKYYSKLNKAGLVDEPGGKMDEASDAKSITIVDKVKNKKTVKNMTSKQFWAFDKKLQKQLQTSNDMNKVSSDWKKGEIVVEINEQTTPMCCNECGNKFKKKLGKNTFEVKCPKCKSYDTEPC